MSLCHEGVKGVSTHSQIFPVKVQNNTLSTKKTNKFKSNNIKLHKSLYAETGKLGVQICRCTREGLKVIPCTALPVVGTMNY